MRSAMARGARGADATGCPVPALEAHAVPFPPIAVDLVDNGRMNNLGRLQQVIRDLHGLESEHIDAVEVIERFEGQTVWQGRVEVFRVRGHSRATHAYAWTYADHDGKLHHLAVLGVPPVDTPQKAVQATVAAHAKARLADDDI